MQTNKGLIQNRWATRSFLLLLFVFLAHCDFAHVQLFATTGPYFAIGAFKTFRKPLVPVAGQAPDVDRKLQARLPLV